MLSNRLLEMTRFILILKYNLRVLYNLNKNKTIVYDLRDLNNI